MAKKKTVIERAAELLRENSEMKFYQAREQARRELGEVDRGAVPGLSEGQRKI